MYGFNISEAGHVVNLLPPQNITGGVTSQAFNLKTAKHASIIIALGAVAAEFTKIILNLCSNASGAGATAIPFNLYIQPTGGAGNDQLGSIQSISAAGYTPAEGANVVYVIEIDANELEAAGVGIGGDGTDSYLNVQLTNGANADYACILAVLSGLRFAEVSSPTVTT